MWTDRDLDLADYTVYYNSDGRQFSNVGTIEVSGTAYPGPYICTPMPPFGSLKNGDGLASIGHGVHVPVNRITNVHHPKSWPAPQYGDGTVLHQYNNGDQ